MKLSNCASTRSFSSLNANQKRKTILSSMNNSPTTCFNSIINDRNRSCCHHQKELAEKDNCNNVANQIQLTDIKMSFQLLQHKISQLNSIVLPNSYNLMERKRFKVDNKKVPPLGSYPSYSFLLKKKRPLETETLTKIENTTLGSSVDLSQIADDLVDTFSVCKNTNVSNLSFFSNLNNKNQHRYQEEINKPIKPQNNPISLKYNQKINHYSRDSSFIDKYKREGIQIEIKNEDNKILKFKKDSLKITNSEALNVIRNTDNPSILSKDNGSRLFKIQKSVPIQVIPSTKGNNTITKEEKGNTIKKEILNNDNKQKKTINTINNEEKVKQITKGYNQLKFSEIKKQIDELTIEPEENEKQNKFRNMKKNEFCEDKRYLQKETKEEKNEVIKEKVDCNGGGRKESKEIGSVDASSEKEMNESCSEEIKNNKKDDKVNIENKENDEDDIVNIDDKENDEEENTENEEDENPEKSDEDENIENEEEEDNNNDHSSNSISNQEHIDSSKNEIILPEKDNIQQIISSPRNKSKIPFEEEKNPEPRLNSEESYDDIFNAIIQKANEKKVQPSIPEKSKINPPLELQCSKIKKAVTFSDEKKVVISYNLKDPITKLSVYDSLGRKRLFTPIKMNKYLSDINSPNNLKPIISNPLTDSQNEKKIALYKLTSLLNECDDKENEKSPMKKNINLIQEISELRKQGKSYPIPKPQKTHVAKPLIMCKKFSDDPQKFFREELCENVLNSYNLTKMKLKLHSPRIKKKKNSIDKSIEQEKETSIEIEKEIKKVNSTGTIMYNIKKYFEEEKIEDDCYSNEEHSIDYSEQKKHMNFDMI